MIGQVSTAAADIHIIDSVCPQNSFRCLRTGDMPPIGLFTVSAKTSADLKLRPNGQQKYGNQQNAVNVIGQKIAVVTVRIIRHKTPRYI